MHVSSFIVFEAADGKAGATRKGATVDTFVEEIEDSAPLTRQAIGAIVTPPETSGSSFVYVPIAAAVAARQT